MNIAFSCGQNCFEPLPDAEAEAQAAKVSDETLRAYCRSFWWNNKPRWDAEGRRPVDARRQAAEQLALLREQTIARLAQMEVPQAIRALILDGRLETRRQDSMMTAAEGAGMQIIVLHGDSGAGKTTSACRFLAARSGRYSQSAYLLSLSPDFSDDRDEVHRICAARVLVIDDLGRGFETEKHRARCEEIICGRFDQGLLTVCTTNKTMDGFIADYGARLKRRLMEQKSCMAIHCTKGAGA